MRLHYLNLYYSIDKIKKHNLYKSGNINVNDMLLLHQN